MFTIKFYSDDGFRQRILEADSFTILRGRDGSAEITLHQKSGDDSSRIDIRGANGGPEKEGPPFYQRAIIENAAGKTTEMIGSFAPGQSGDGRPPAGRDKGTGTINAQESYAHV